VHISDPMCRDQLVSRLKRLMTEHHVLGGGVEIGRCSGTVRGRSCLAGYVSSASFLSHQSPDQALLVTILFIYVPFALTALVDIKSILYTHLKRRGKQQLHFQVR
jgi:hypothetical protein